MIVLLSDNVEFWSISVTLSSASNSDSLAAGGKLVSLESSPRNGTASISSAFGVEVDVIAGSLDRSSI